MHVLISIRRAFAAAVSAASLAGCAGGSAAVPAALSGVATVRNSTSGAGSLDGSFGRKGKATVSLALQPVAAAVAADGRIVIAGNVGSGFGRIAAVRLLTDGTVDSSFGSHGIASASMSSVASLTLLSNGKVLLGGIAPSGNDAELLQLSAAGTPDTSFGSAGVVRFDYVVNSSNAVLAVVPQPDGKIVAGGFGLATNSDDYLTSLARFDSRGNADPSFGNNGIVSFDLVGGVTALGLQSDGKILVCGGFITAATSLVVRFLRDGKLDQSDGGGTPIAVAHTGSLTFGGTNAFQLDGKLVQWRRVQRHGGTRYYIQIVRRLRDYSLDPAFQSITFAFGTSKIDQPNDVDIAPDGKLLVGGQGALRGQAVFGLARLTPSGPLDGTFGQRGRVVTDFTRGANATALALQPDGKIVLAGVAHASGSNYVLAVARYLGN